MGDIKSAREIAMEKIEKLGEPTQEERLKWKYVPQGEELAAKYLKESINMLHELGQHPEDIRKYIIEGASQILVRNMDLPKNDVVKKNNKKAMDGLKILKSDKAGLENVFSRIRNIFNHYENEGKQQRKQAYESLKIDFENKIQQAIQQQIGTFMPSKVDVEAHPQFNQEWLKITNQMDSQYISLLNELKQELLNIA
jgi:hypothetical protein